MSKHNYPTSMRYQRTVLPLGETHSRITVSMSFDSHLAIAYATALVQQFHALKVPLAALVRRAVLFYAQALGSMSEAGRRAEAQAVKDAARGGCPIWWQRQEAEERLKVLDVSQPVPFKEVLSGPDHSRPLDIAALDAAVDAVAATHKPKTTRGTYAPK